MPEHHAAANAAATSQTRQRRGAYGCGTSRCQCTADRNWPPTELRTRLRRALRGRPIKTLRNPSAVLIGD